MGVEAYENGRIRHIASYESVSVFLSSRIRDRQNHMEIKNALRMGTREHFLTCGDNMNMHGFKTGLAWSRPKSSTKKSCQNLASLPLCTKIIFSFLFTETAERNGRGR